MKTVLFMINAKSEKVSSKKTDYACRITDKGKKETLSVLKSFISNKDLKFDRIVSSVALRAFDTASLAADKTGFKKSEIVINEYLYLNCNAETIKKMFDSMDDSLSSIIVVGHNLSISETVNKIFPEFTIKMPDSSAVCLSFKTDNWSKIFEASPEFRFYHYIMNSDLSKIDRMAKKDIIKRSETGLNDLVKKIGEEVAFSDSKDVEKKSRTFFKNVIKQASVVTITDYNELKKVKAEIENNEKLKEEKRIKKAAEKENKIRLKLEKKNEEKKTKALTTKEKLELKKLKIEKKVKTKDKKIEKLSGIAANTAVSGTEKKKKKNKQETPESKNTDELNVTSEVITDNGNNFSSGAADYSLNE